MKQKTTESKSRKEPPSLAQDKKVLTAWGWKQKHLKMKKKIGSKSDS